MAKFEEFDIKGFHKWLKGRPPIIQELGNRLPPDRLYLLKTSGHRVIIHAYHEDKTLTVIVSGQWNLVTIERKVFGIKPDNLEECDFPSEDEPKGVLYNTKEEIDAYIQAMKNENSQNLSKSIH